ncbi:MAG: Crp/Fnr family transcriptional regulator [Tannerellaceae bacterium]|jgi:CRP-like cAMP-binding protein|nr:Crp/Fnr family transcriptional regulator [Tannerellaceae bacterium]
MNEEFLKNYFTERQLSKEELEVVLPHFKKVSFEKNDYLIEAGKVAGYYWFLDSGFIRSYTFDPEGNDVTTAFYLAGDIVIDWSSFFLRQPTREYMQAAEPCVCWELDYKTFQMLFHSIEAFREQGRATLVGSYFALKERSISMITDLAKDRYLRLIKDKPDIFQHASLKHIATYLGITDTSLSRIRKEIVTNG